MKDTLYKLERQKQLVLEDLQRLDTSKENKKFFIDFTNHLIGSEGVTLHRVLAYYHKYKHICIITEKNFRNLTKKDIDKIMVWVNSSERNNGRGFSVHTKNDFTKALKKMFRYLHGLTSNDPAPELVKHLKKQKTESKLRREDLFTPDEVRKLIDACITARDRALISVMFESACRPGELRGLKLEDIVKKHRGYRLFVNGKTGRRAVFVVASETYLNLWIDQHPYKDDKSAPLFCNLNNKESRIIGITNLTYIIRSKAKRARLDKRYVNPYVFRHSRIMNMLENRIPECVIKKYVGHAPESNALSHYLHLIDEDVENASLKMAGYDIKETSPERFEPIRCPICNENNNPNGVICRKCKNVLNPDGVIKQETENSLPMSPEGLKTLVHEVMRPMIQEELDKMWEAKK